MRNTTPRGARSRAFAILTAIPVATCCFASDIPTGIAGPAEPQGAGEQAQEKGDRVTPIRILLAHVAPEAPSWSPDGAHLLVDDQESFGLRIVPAAGGPARTITDDPYRNTAAWSPVEDVIAFIDKGDPGLYTMPVTAPMPDLLVAGPVEGYAAPWSPDGRRLLFQREGRLEVVEVATGKVTTLAQPASDGNPVINASWSADGRLVVAQRRREIVVVDLERHDMQIVPDISGRAPSFGPDGAIWLIGDGDERPLLIYRDGRIEIAEEVGKGVLSFDVHPRSGDLALAVKGRGITVWHPASRTPRILTDGRGDHSPRWSPDGRAVAFVRSGENGITLCVVEVAEGQP